MKNQYDDLTKIVLWHNQEPMIFEFNGAWLRLNHKYIRTPDHGPWYDEQHAEIMQLLHNLETALYKLGVEELG